MSSLVWFLMAFPLLVAAVLFAVEKSKVRDAIVVGACAIVAAASVATAFRFADGATVFFGLPGGRLPGHAPLVIEAVITLVILAASAKHRRLLPPALALVQLGVGIGLELSAHGPGTDPERLFYFDRLSMVMVIVIGVIGCLICVHALGYMRDFHRHYPMIKGRRTSFFFLLFLFLSAMFGLVCSNDLPLMFVFWEVTTLCSFLLIGYTGSKDATKYAFNALNMNLLGGCGFAVALLVLARVPGGLELSRLTAAPATAAVLPAVALLALAGITKSAQMPFSSWLLGAMYAPTPTSALLHSSTMVKAGVFLLLKLSPTMAGTFVGTCVAFVGLLTFLSVSLVAMTEHNTKKVLAYSTIGNLGLIVGCAGVGAPAALWVGVMIVVFHAVAKSLLFLLVGTLENRLYTKDMENFDNLVSRMPRVSLLALCGIAGMFIAPFGIVVAKWSAIRAFVDVPGWVGAAYLVIMAFGSSCTIFYWAKLLIKVLSTRQISDYERSVESRIPAYEWFSETSHAVLVVLVAASVGLLSSHVVTPYVADAFRVPDLQLFHLDPLTVTSLVVAVLWLPVMAWWTSRAPRYDLADVYASGRTMTADHVMDAGLGNRRTVTLRNYYLEGVIDGTRVFRVGTAACAVLLSAMVVLETLVKP
jgi:ech hydrogenase subunit A